MSAASFPLAFPPTIATGFGWPQAGMGVEGVNSRVANWLLGLLGGRAAGLDDGPRVRGWVLLDFFAEPEAGLVPLLIECNFRGRRLGEEGW
jgi:1-phosphatidylinositol phosphodiesterase